MAPTYAKLASRVKESLTPINTLDFRGQFCIKLVRFLEYNYFYFYKNALA
jgi:hypothetical protein